MKLESIMKLGNIKEVTDNAISKDIDLRGVYIGDLLSVVMGKAKEGQLWLTIQTHLNIIAVASLLEVAAIIVVEGMKVEEATISKANEVGIPIFESDMSAYELAKVLAEEGV
ncbi:MAG: serine kinase [Tissierellales bacterium]|jgi:predicted transcriptional regulator|nr:serine kinase [Tissierellales bacterium]